MPQSLAELVDLLDLEEIEVGLFRARQPDTPLQRVFGGQVLAQALVAAARTVAVTRVLHSLHAYFLRPGRTDIPIVYDVETIRDGGSFSSRRVVARQGGEVIFYLSSSFHEVEDGFEHADPVPDDVPGPDECPTARRGAVQGLGPLGGPVGAGVGRARRPLRRRLATGRDAGGPAAPGPGPGLGRGRTATLPDDRRLHQAALAYASDLTLLSATTVPHNVFIGLNVQAHVAGPRDVVPPAVPGRRLAALRPDLALGLRAASACPPPASSSTAPWSPTWPKRA